MLMVGPWIAVLEWLKRIFLSLNGKGAPLGFGQFRRIGQTPQTRANQGKPGQTRANQGKPGQTRANQGKPGQTRANQGTSPKSDIRYRDGLPPETV